MTIFCLIRRGKQVFPDPCIITSCIFSPIFITLHTVTAYAKYGDYILGVVFYPKPSSVSDVAGIQSVHASLN